MFFLKKEKFVFFKFVFFQPKSKIEFFNFVFFLNKMQILYFSTYTTKSSDSHLRKKNIISFLLENF